jgi:hypothetical protein
MPSLFPIIVIATQIVLVADSVPKFNVERTCRAAAESGLPGRDSASCQRDEQDARSKLEKDWSSIQRNTAKPVRWPCHNRWRTKLCGAADLSRNGKAREGAASRFQDGKSRWPPLIV